MKTATIVLLLIGFVTLRSHAQVGIGTTTPKALLHVDEGSVVFSNAGDLLTPGASPFAPVFQAGRRMMWFGEKAAFRAGYVDGNQWNGSFTGDYSVAMGNSTTASNYCSIALGKSTTASGTVSLAMGGLTIASGAMSTAMGGYTTASGDYSVAMGLSTTASGIVSTAIGRNTIAPSAYETAIGYNNTTYSPSSTTDWIPSDRLFVIGNGGAGAGPNDALTVFKNGNLVVNGDAAKPGSASWTVTSDMRTKRNIKHYLPGLKEVMAINPVRFQYNHLSGYADTTRQYVGILAQEIEKILPSTVSIVVNDPLVKNKRVYDSSELVYALINAVKELSAINEKLNTRLSVLEEIEKTRTSPPAPARLIKNNGKGADFTVR